MRHLSASGVSGQFLHEIPILATPLVSGRVFEVKILLDIVGRKFNSGLLVLNRPLCPNTNRVPMLANDFRYISGVILTGVVRLEGSRSDFVRD